MIITFFYSFKKPARINKFLQIIWVNCYNLLQLEILMKKQNLLLILTTLILLLSSLLLNNCGSGTNLTATTTTTTLPTPVNLSIFTYKITDEANDQTDFPDGGTYFDETDFRQVAVAYQNNRIYIYVQVVGTFETDLEFSTNGTAEIHARAINIGIDLDNNTSTGGLTWGMDLQGTYGISSTLTYETAYYGVYQFNENDTHVIDRYDCTINNGGLGYNYVVFSVPTSEITYLGVTLTKGATIGVFGWAETSAGFDSEGNELYHDYAFDTLGEKSSTRNTTYLGGP